MPDFIPERDLFKPAEVAFLFSVSSRKVYQWLRYGKIKYIKFAGTVRIPREAIIELKDAGGKGFTNHSKRAMTNRLALSLRGRINKILHGKLKTAGTMKLVGCTPEEFIAHIEKQFQPGMTMENYGEWHIDHIIPCAKFDLANPDHQKICFHFSNLQPLWAKKNISKEKKVNRRNLEKVCAYYHNLHKAS
ncbi:MAG: helix-turn-helix domain-containing protein [Candidatus Omnitrophica bacterium]|nr:helix-turn-helix domain-containing protein [Candidatus Omnitrophota bacterium]